MPADVLTVGDALATAFTNRFALLVPPCICERVYETTHDLGEVDGRKVEIYPLSYVPFEPATREEAYYDFRYSIVTLERFREHKRVPRIWLDDRVTFVEEQIFNPLDPTNKERAELILVIDSDSYWPIEVECTTVYEYNILRQNKVFWSEVEVVFRKLDKGLV